MDKNEYEWYNKKFFKRYAFFYDYLEIFIKSIRKDVANRIKKENRKILDMACGTGSQSIAFAKMDFEVVGIDLSPDMLEYADKKIKSTDKVKFINGDATNINYKDSFFDASSISFGLHDMPEEIGLKVLKEMIRTTKKDGQIIIVDYDAPKNKIISWLGYKIAKIWESRYYDNFMNKTVNYYLKKVNLKPVFKKNYFFGNIQVIECINKK